MNCLRLFAAKGDCMEKNIYGLAEGVYKACQYLGLKFPEKALPEGEHFPSDYFGDDFKLDSATKKNLRLSIKWSSDKFERIYKNFAEKFESQKPLKQNATDLNVYFCDYILFVGRKLGASTSDYFDFEFYNKSFELRDTFIVDKHVTARRIICNDFSDMELVNNKARTNAVFADFIHRDWIDASTCTFEEFKLFVEKYPRFFSKPVAGIKGKGVKINKIDPMQNLKKLFIDFKDKKNILEEIINQHKELAAFCPSTVNTIRVVTFLDIHNVAHILTATGRFGKVGGVADNPQLGGYYATVDPKTGVIISDAINRAHERFKAHPDTEKIFKGFEYPAWQKVRKFVKTLAKIVPSLRHIGWDIAINDKGEPILVEANGGIASDTQQAADSVGRLYLYHPLLDDLQNYQANQMRRLGYRSNNPRDFMASYEDSASLRQDSRLKQAMLKLIPDCKSLMDLGCRKAKFVKSICSENVQYIPVDFKKHDDEVIACDFNKKEFPDIKADVCLCAFTAEYVKYLSQFLANMCNAAQKQILIWACPVDKELNKNARWKNPFPIDFIEEFLIKTIEQNNFKLTAQYPDENNHAVILYDFRRT